MRLSVFKPAQQGGAVVGWLALTAGVILADLSVRHWWGPSSPQLLWLWVWLTAARSPVGLGASWGWGVLYGAAVGAPLGFYSILLVIAHWQGQHHRPGLLPAQRWRPLAWAVVLALGVSALLWAILSQPILWGAWWGSWGLTALLAGGLIYGRGVNHAQR